MEDQETQVTVIDKSIDVFKKGSAILLEHQKRASKAMTVAQSIIDEWEAVKLLTDPKIKAERYAAVDARSNKFLANCSTTKGELEESRKAITQLMDTVRGMFTAEESKLDPKTSEKAKTIQQNRNSYVTWRQNEDRRIAKEAEDRKNKATEEAEIRANVTKAIARWLLDFLAQKKMDITNKFNAITLDTFADLSEKLKKMPTTFPKDKLNVTFRGFTARYHDATEVEAIENAEKEAFNYEPQFGFYTAEITALKQSLVDQLPSKQAELEEAEERRLQAIEDEKERQKKIAAENDEKKKKQLEEQAERERKRVEDDRLRAEQERRDRESAEKRRLEREAEAKKKEEEDRIEMERQSKEADAAFEQAQASAGSAETPASRSSVEITVLKHAGWVQIFQYWFTKEGCLLDVEEFEKKTMKQMKTFCEKAAKENESNKIISEYLTYKTVFKAMNKKAV